MKRSPNAPLEIFVSVKSNRVLLFEHPSPPPPPKMVKHINKFQAQVKQSALPLTVYAIANSINPIEMAHNLYFHKGGKIKHSK